MSERLGSLGIYMCLSPKFGLFPQDHIPHYLDLDPRNLPEEKSRQPQEEEQQQQQQTQRKCPKRPDLPYMTTTTPPTCTDPFPA